MQISTIKFTLLSISEIIQSSSTILNLPPEVVENNILKYLTCEDIRSFALFGSLIGSKQLHDIATKVEGSRSKCKWNHLQIIKKFQYILSE